MARYTEKTIVQIDDAVAALGDIRKSGYAVEMEELALGRACIAAPVLDRTGRVAAGISISAPLSMKLNERLDELSALLIEMAGRISMKMGHVPMGTMRL
uniref:IclR family transcriptional regulator C-terminal domain-containing protein n=1 Tax=Paenibacillus oceani TaxID=2772510 RepID=UPI00295BE77B|nr:IclR family transcriptional regulator C-terminal domain-containing protein [Paenibacillus oceani]